MPVGDKDKSTGALVIGGVIGTAFGVAVATLLTGRPAEAAPPDVKTDYIIQLLEQMAQGNVLMIGLLEQLLAAHGVEVPGVEIAIKTSWEAKEPESIFDRAIRSPGTFDADRMVEWIKGKRLLLKVESSLNQAVTIQVIGNFVDDMNLATNINAALPCPANSNISVGLAWDDWCSFIGVRITTAIAPTAGILNIWAVIQE